LIYRLPARGRKGGREGSEKKEWNDRVRERGGDRERKRKVEKRGRRKEVKGWVVFLQ